MSRRTVFTLLEIIIAMAILSMAITSMMVLSSGSVRQTDQAFVQWESTHRLVQAAEFFLTVGPNETIDNQIFDSTDYLANCSLENPEGMPNCNALDTVSSMSQNLKTLHITVKNRKTGKVDELFIDKIVPEDL